MPVISCIGNSAANSEERELRRQRKQARLISNRITRQLKEAQKDERCGLKLLLLGTGESGKSTILKQMKIIHINGFSDHERLAYIPLIRKNVRDSILSILGAMDTLKISFECDDTAVIGRKLLENSGDEAFVYSQVFYDDTHVLWNDEGVQACFSRSHEYQLIDSAKYFLDRLNIIRQNDYTPCEQDILRCRVLTDAISEVNFEVRESRHAKVKFKVFDVGGQRGVRKRWIQLFDSVTAILFIADCSSFDQTLREDRTKNRLLDALEVFEQVWMNKYLQKVPILVFLNKVDLLEEKMKLGQRITNVCAIAHKWAERHSVSRPLSFPSLENGPQIESTQPDDRLNPHGQEVNSFFPLRNTKELASSVIGIFSSAQRLFQSQTLTNDTGQAKKRMSSMLQDSSVPRPTSSRYSTAGSAATTVYGATSRLSCSASVAELVLNYPYERFTELPDERMEFLSSYPVENSDQTMKSQRSRLRSSLFPDLHPETVRTACYIKNLFVEITRKRVRFFDGNPSNRKCFFYYTCAVDTRNIEKVLDGCRRYLIEDHLERVGFL